MNYITTQDLFIGELNTIFNSTCATDELLTNFIEKYEPRILIDILGNDFYVQLQTALDSPLTSKWDILVNGGSFNIDGVAHYFQGLKYITAAFIFYHYHANNSYTPSQTAASIPNLENSTTKSMGFKMMTIWNDATEQIGYACAGNNLRGYLENADFEGFEINLYKGGKIKGLQWLS